MLTVPLTWTVVGKCKLLEMVKRRKENAEGLEAALQRVGGTKRSAFSQGRRWLKRFAKAR